MKALKYIFLILLFASVARSQNVKITDFDIPVSSARQLFFNGFYNWSQSTPLGDTLTPKNVQSDFRIDANFNRFYSSPAFAWNTAITGSIFGRRDDTTRYSYNLDADVSKYFSTSKGFFGNGAISSAYIRQKEFGVEDRPTINIFGGVGYGRQVNATALAKAIRIDEELKKSGVNTKFMPKSTMLAIAAIIDKEDEYRDTYKQIYEAKIIEDISKEVQKSGVMRGDQISSLAYFRIRSVLFAGFFGSVNYNLTNPRFYGGDIRLGVSYQALTRNEKIKTPNPSLEIRGRYGYPIGLNSQLYFTLNARTSFDSTFGKVYEAEGGADYWYNITNRVVFNLGYRLNLVRAFSTQFINNQLVTVSDDFSTANHNVFAAFTFYLENYISLQLKGGYNRIHANTETWTTNAIVSFIVF